MTRFLTVDELTAGLRQLSPAFYSGWTADTVRAWCKSEGIPIRSGLIAERDVLAVIDRRSAERARQALAD